MPADAVIVVVLILVVGCASFIFGVLYLIGRLIGGVGHCMMRVVRPGRRYNRGGAVSPPSRMQVCPRQECRHVEYRYGARFCGRCGTRLCGTGFQPVGKE